MRTLRIMRGLYEICRLDAAAELPAWTAADRFISITRTDAELSIVRSEGRALPGSRREGGFVLLKVEGPLEFSEVGVVASLSAPLASAGISIFVVSTFDTDYLLVRQDSLTAAREALQAAGHAVLNEWNPTP